MSTLFLGSVVVGAILLAVATRLPRSIAGTMAVLGFGVVGAGVVASVISGDEGGPILLAGGIGLVWLHRWARRDRRRLALARFARQHGLRFRSRSRAALREHFRLFGRWDGCRARNLLVGSWNGVPVKTMDYDCFTTRTAWLFYPVKRWHRFSVAVVNLGGSIPSVLAERNGAPGLATEYMGFHDVQLNSEEFNRRFHVTTDDREFAYTFYNAEMLRWLLDQPELVECEVLGRKALVALPRLRPEEMGRLFDVAAGFHAHMPPRSEPEFDLPEPAGL